MARHRVQRRFFPRYVTSRGEHVIRSRLIARAGNEEDYIVVSLVRTRDLGFLKSLRRTNVMLSRCKRGMYICSSRAFLINGRGADSLAGKMAAHFGDPAWISMADLEGGNY